MRRALLITIFALCTLCALARPYGVKEIPNVQIENRYNFTSNPDKIISQDAVAHIDSICYNLNEQGIAQIAVVVVKEIQGNDVFDFAYELFSSWGVGGKNNNGIGILLVEREREIRFVTGYGIEGVLPDAICKRIQTQYMLPHFRRGDYSSGLKVGIEAISYILNGNESELADINNYQEDDTEAIIALLIFIFTIVAIVLFTIVAIDRYSRKCPRCKKLTLQKGSTHLLNNQFGISTYEDSYVCTACGKEIKRMRHEDNSSNNRHGGGPIIMGGLGGNFKGGSSIGGGWGGGRFGGGGAGSRW